MKKKIIRIIFVMGIILFCLLVGKNNVKALSFGEVKGTADNFIKNGTAAATITMDEAEKLLPLGKILYGAGILVVVITGLIMGVQYMISGSDEKAKLKEKLIWWVVSVVVITSAVSIINLIINIMNDII